MAERRKDPKSSEADDQLREFLVGVATDPAALGNFVKDPETSMSEAGLSAEDQAVLRSGNPGAINARLASGPGGASGPMMLVVDVAGDQVNVRPLLQFPQPPLQIVFPISPGPIQPPLQIQQPPLQLLQQPPLQIQQPPLQIQQPPLQIQQPPLMLQGPPPLLQLQWPIHPPIWPPPPPQIHWPIHPPPIWPPPPPQIVNWPPPQLVFPPPPQLVFQQIHPMLVAPGPLGG